MTWTVGMCHEEWELGHLYELCMLIESSRYLRTSNELYCKRTSSSHVLSVDILCFKTCY